MKKLSNLIVLLGFALVFTHVACVTKQKPKEQAMATAAPVQKERLKLASGIFKKTMWAKEHPAAFYADEAVTGITVMAYWSELNPAPGVYNWARLDTMCSRASANNKLIAFNIGTGSRSPGWVINNSGALTFKEFKHVSTQSKPTPVEILQPIVFRPAYIADISRFIADFGAHCRAQTYWKDIVLVSCGGISRTTEEIRLPCQDDVKIGAYTSTNATRLWGSVGYTSDTVISAFNKIADAWIAAFPKRVISYSFINGKDFINTTPEVFSVTCLSLFEKCKASPRGNTCIYKYTSLDNETAYSRKMEFIDSFNGPQGAQLEEQKYSVLALKDSNDLTGALDQAIARSMGFVEMDFTTVERFNSIVTRYNKIIK